MFDSPPMIGPLLAAMKVSPSHARPRMPMTAVMPAWQVLVVTILAAGALVTISMIAAIASITTAMVIGMLTTIGTAAPGGAGVGAGGSGAGAVVGVSAASGSVGTAGLVVAGFAASGSSSALTGAEATFAGATFTATLVTGAALAGMLPTCRIRGNNPHSTTSITPAMNSHADSDARGGSALISSEEDSLSFNSPDATRRRYSGSLSSSTPTRVCTSAATITPSNVDGMQIAMI